LFEFEYGCANSFGDLIIFSVINNDWSLCLYRDFLACRKDKRDKKSKNNKYSCVHYCLFLGLFVLPVKRTCPRLSQIVFTEFRRAVQQLIFTGQIMELLLVAVP
jgi:hypothetical protein